MITDGSTSINEPGKSRQSFSPPSINEPPEVLDDGDKPVITSLDPATCAIGDPAFTLDVTGSGFKDGSVIVMDGISMTTTYNDESTLSTPIDPVWWSTAGVIQTAVRTGLQTSDPVDFTVTDAAPEMKAADPDELEDEIEQEIEEGDITRVTVTKVSKKKK